MASTPEQKRNYLDILAVFHYVNGALSLFFTLFILAFLGIGLGAATGWGGNWEMEPGCSITAIMLFIFILVGGYGVLNLIAGRALQTRSNYVMVLVTAAVNCLNVPLGTLLGIFTLVLLSDPTVRPIFDHADVPATAPARSEPPQPPVE